MKNNTGKLKTFNYLENGDVLYSSFNSTACSNTLLPGFYDLSIQGSFDREEIVLKQLTFSESTLELNNYEGKENVDNYFDTFFKPDTKTTLNNLGFHNRGGILLYGKEGTGKTTIIKNLCQKAITEHKALVMYIDISKFAKVKKLLSMVRDIQDNPIIIIFEEFDSISKDPYLISVIKTFMDGNDSIDNVFTFATTNHIQDIPEALKDRPSRFKYSIECKEIEDEETIFEVAFNILKDKKVATTLSKELKGSTLDLIKHASLDHLLGLSGDLSKSRNKIGYK